MYPTISIACTELNILSSHLWLQLNDGNAFLPPDKNQEFLQFLHNKININDTNNWASEASPTLGCSIEISRDI